MLTHHTRLNYPAMRLLMPNDTLYVTILRHPVSLFESMYSYYHLDKFYGFGFDQFDNQTAKLPNFERRFVGKIGPNQMLFDLGYSVNRPSGRILQAYAQQIESTFDLVMIEELLDESLVFLKNLLCWTVDDVITFKVGSKWRSW